MPGIQPGGWAGKFEINGVEEMNPENAKEINGELDALIGSRQSVSKFKPEIPPRQSIMQIIQAGMLSPFAGLSRSGKDFRRFIVFPRESEATQIAAILIARRSAALREMLERQREQIEFQRQLGRQSPVEIEITDQGATSNIGLAPYLIIVAQERGIMAEEHLSLAHSMENMWLKSNAIGLGFQLLSIIVQMADDRAFCGLIDIPFGRYALDGCLIGYSTEPTRPSSLLTEAEVDSVTRWL